jgi:hypothetical protein
MQNRARFASDSRAAQIKRLNDAAQSREGESCSW